LNQKVPGIDIRELSFSFKSYLKYLDMLEARLVDILDKFKLAVSKSISGAIDFVAEIIEMRSIDSKITLADLKETLETQGVNIRDALYNQLSNLLDVEKNDTLHIKSFCDYLRDPSMKHFDFFKVNSSLLTQYVVDFFKTTLEMSDRSLDELEREFSMIIPDLSRNPLSASVF
jgi:hypothetical protein